MKTIVVNFYAGPGAGKTTLCNRLFSLLKMRGLNVEQALEFAKDKVWEESFGVLTNQIYIFGKQHHRIFRLNGKVQVILTDSPLLISLLYDSSNNSHFRKMVHEEYQKFDNLDVFVNRNKEYNPSGRMQTEQSAKELDDKMINILKEEIGLELRFVKYDETSIDEVCEGLAEEIIYRLLRKGFDK